MKIGSEVPLSIDVVECGTDLVSAFVKMESTEFRSFLFFFPLISRLTSLLTSSVRSSTFVKLLKFLRLLRLREFSSPSAIKKDSTTWWFGNYAREMIGSIYFSVDEFGWLD